jgi:hypothetical protein
MAKKPSLRLVQETTWPKPPRPLGKHGQSLWDRVMSEYAIADSGGIEMLTLACQALDRAESLRAMIDQDGEVIRSRNGPKEHPALRSELANRAFVARTLVKLGINSEPVKAAAGRPLQGFGWVGEG